MTLPKTRVTEADYLATMTGEKPALEYIDGEIIQKPMTKRDHNDIAMKLFGLLSAFGAERPGSYVTWEATTYLGAAGEIRYRVPDLAYWDSGRPLTREDDVYLPPSLAIEIRSSGQSLELLRDKCREYLANGVDACWLVDPAERTVEVFEGAGAQIVRDGTIKVAALPGLAVDVVTLWD